MQTPSLCLYAGGIACLLACLNTSPALAVEVILPQNRTAFYASEAMEIAVAGLSRGGRAEVGLMPTGPAKPPPVRLEFVGDGGTITERLSPFSLAPGVYGVALDGRPTPLRLTISSGVRDSTMLISQTVGLDQVKSTGGNFSVGTAAEFGLVGPDGLPSKDPRRPGGLVTFDQAVTKDVPTLVYQYWTGYTTHKPWGSHKSWADAAESETMRLFNLHEAQRLRKFAKNIISIGTIDEPGLSWGRTPEGHDDTMFPNWDEADWYRSRGWQFTDDPAARPAADWLKYGRVRDSIIGEQQDQAHRDFKSIWPGVVFSTDNYVPDIVNDGAESMNQRTNDIPATHVFLDWGIGRLDAISSVYVEKAFNPTAPIAHAMNGQLTGAAMPSDVQQNCYRGMLNSLLAAGLHSNWWLNFGAITSADLAAVNEPARRLGPVFEEMRPTGHDVAVLWSQTQLLMQDRPVVAYLAHHREPLKITVPALPENSAVRGPYTMEWTPYSVGQNYREQVMNAHAALDRAGYPAHIVHEQIAAAGILRHYRTLLVVGQRAPLPPAAKIAIEKFAAAGGQVLVDPTTTIRIRGARMMDVDLKNPLARWSPLFGLADKKPDPFASEREASYFQTNVFMDEMIRRAVPAIKTAMSHTASRPIFAAATTDLIGERHEGGEGELLMLLNAHEELPHLPPDRRYSIWNYAPYTCSVALRGIKPGSVVYRIEGADWRQVTRVQRPGRLQSLHFVPGEMKLFLVAPGAPGGLLATARIREGALIVAASLKGLRMPWPITVTITSPGGKELYRVYRSTDGSGTYTESFPVGLNGSPGRVSVTVQSPVGNLAAKAGVDLRPSTVGGERIAGPVRVFDAGAIKQFLAGRPAIVIALGDHRYTSQAQRLAAGFARRGIRTEIKDEKAVYRRHRYPRVFDPYLKVYVPLNTAKTPPGRVDRRLSLQIEQNGVVTAVDSSGKDWGDDWRHPYTLAVIGPQGFIDYSAADGEEMYQPGCEIYVDGQIQMAAPGAKLTAVKATPEMRLRWSRPWQRLSSYNGGFNLPPQLPEAYAVDSHLVLMGDSTSGELAAALQASELLPEVADERYPGPGKALLSFAWSPFGLGKNVIVIGAPDEAGVTAGVDRLLALAGLPQSR